MRGPSAIASAPLMRFLRSEAGAVVLWVIFSLILAATVVPWLHTGGQWLAAEAEAKELPALLESVGASASRADFGRYFNRALMISALVLMPFLVRRMRFLRARRGPVQAAKKRTLWKPALLHVFLGFLIAGGILWLTGSALEAADAFTKRSETPSVSRFISNAVVPAIGASLVEEWVFRGLLLGVWLRIAKPLAACLGTSLVFAFVHFLEPPGADLENPGSPVAGFVALGRILLHFTDPRFFVTDFATLFVVGLILAASRIRTGSLWFPIGLHAGWVFTFKAFNLLHRHDSGSPLSPWWVGDNLRSGIFPLLALVATAAACHFVLRKIPSAAGQPSGG